MPAMTIRDLDTSGLKCPLPVLKAKKALGALDSGDRLRVVSTDPSALKDFPAYCETAGHALLEATNDGTKYVFLIEKVS